MSDQETRGCKPTQTDQKAFPRAVPSALVCGQLFLKDGRSLLQEVNLEKTPCMRRGDAVYVANGRVGLYLNSGNSLDKTQRLC